jgi:hypothetical protein
MIGFMPLVSQGLQEAFRWTVVVFGTTMMSTAGI